MKKRRYLKRWVQIVLTTILLISLMVLGGESESCFITSKIIAMTTAILSGYIYFRYSKIEVE